MSLKILEPNLGSYADARKNFSWDQQWKMLLGPGLSDFVNLGELATRHAMKMGLSQHRALRFIDQKGDREDWTYQQLDQASEKAASAFQSLGLKAEERIFSLLPKCSEAHLTALGALRNGNVFSPLYSSFGPEPIKTRLNLGEAKVIVTTEEWYRKKVAPIRAQVPTLKDVILTDLGRQEAKKLKAHSWDDFLAQGTPRGQDKKTKMSDPAILHFTSGTTGLPKGVIQSHASAVQFFITGRLALDFHPDDVFWCTADSGWVTGTSYGIFSPLLNGVSSVIDSREFDPHRWYKILQDESVSVWYTSPTALRMLMREDSESLNHYDFSSLRLVGSVGEPLNAGAVLWGQEAFRTPILDHWWQTETGGIMISNFRGLPVKPGSMGVPMPGIEVAVVERSPEGKVQEILAPLQKGEIAIKQGWPSMFQCYLGQPRRYEACFRDGYYLTGDLAMKDQDGYYWFLGRADDVIKSSGHLIGPFEVEKILMEHPTVLEAAVIGKPDSLTHERVKAFVSLRKGFQASETLAREIQAFARTRLGPSLSPKEIAFLDRLPHTRSGKVMRRLLRARELGLPEGDLSTLEGNP